MSAPPAAATGTALASRPAEAVQESPRSSRLPDFLNPIFVREVQQSLKGRAFFVTMLLALAAVVLIAVVSVSEGAGRTDGRQAFELTLMAMVPILMVLVPLQAFHSMRQEMRSGTAELLLLSSLTPWRIVTGKLMAAMAHYFLYLGVFAPLIAFTFLLRGVDVPTIVVSLSLGALACVLASLLAIAMGTLTRWRAVAPLVSGLSGLVLAGAALPVMIAIVELNLELFTIIAGGHGWDVLGTILFFGVSLAALFAVIAASQLTHENENRSTGFRVLVAAFVAAMFAWVSMIVPPNHRYEAFPVVAIACAVVSSFFFLFAVTEEEPLSPRVRAHVPKNARLALLSAPFLPGGGRGLLFALILLAATMAVGLIGSYLFHSHSPGHSTPPFAAVCTLVALYAFFYAGLGRIIRARLRPGPAGTWVARVIVPLCLIAACLLPFIPMILFLRHGPGPGPESWNVLHLLNPFYTIGAHSSDPELPLSSMAVVCVFVFVLNLQTIIRGVLEVLEASRRRTEPARERQPATAIATQ